MIASIVARALERLREWWSVDDPDERIEGSGEIYLDPAYNGRYEAERELQRLGAADEGDDEAASTAGREP